MARLAVVGRYTVTLKRNSQSYFVLAVIFPTITFVLASFAVFWLDPNVRTMRGQRREGES